MIKKSILPMVTALLLRLKLISENRECKPVLMEVEVHYDLIRFYSSSLVKLDFACLKQIYVFLSLILLSRVNSSILSTPHLSDPLCTMLV